MQLISSQLKSFHTIIEDIFLSENNKIKYVSYETQLPMKYSADSSVAPLVDPLYIPGYPPSGNVMLRRFVRNSKNDPIVDEVELTSVNPAYTHIRYPDGRESTVSLKDLSPYPSPEYNPPSPPSANIPVICR